MIFFLVIAVIAAVAGIAMVAARNPVHSALFLVLNFFCLAILYLTLNAQFLAAIQIFVYAGAIMVLFLFVITLLNPGREEHGTRLPAQRPLAAVLGLALLAEVVLLLKSGTVRALLAAFPPTRPFAEQFSQPGLIANAPSGIGNTQALGAELFTAYLLPFEVTSVLLLIAVIGAVVVAKRQLR